MAIAVDTAGADLGAAEVAAGARIAADRGVEVILFGPAAELGPGGNGVSIVDAPVSIAKEGDPARAVRARPESSIVQAAKAVGSGEAAALVCAGTTGPALAAGLFHIKRAKGIHRPALAITVPVPGDPVTLLDVGANAEVRLEHLVQFAFMGAAFATSVLGVARPRVGLLSNGVEPTRGSELVVATHAALRELAADHQLDFIGNVEGDGLAQGVADVIITDGFTGNVALKLIEGVSRKVLDEVRATAKASMRATLGGLLLRPALRSFRDEIDPEAAGGAYLLGLQHLGVIPHGRFSRRGIAAAIMLAQKGVDEDVVGRTHAALEAAGVLRVTGRRAAADPDTVGL